MPGYFEHDNNANISLSSSTVDGADSVRRHSVKRDKQTLKPPHKYFQFDVDFRLSPMQITNTIRKYPPERQHNCAYKKTNDKGKTAAFQIIKYLNKG